MTHSLRYGPFLSTKIDGKGSRTYSSWFLPERRYASACTSYGPVSVCLLQVGVLLKRINEPSRSLARELPYNIYYTREKVQLPPEITVTSLCNVARNSGLGENFATTACRSCRNALVWLSSRKTGTLRANWRWRNNSAESAACDVMEA